MAFESFLFVIVWEIVIFVLIIISILVFNICIFVHMHLHAHLLYICHKSYLVHQLLVSIIPAVCFLNLQYHLQRPDVSIRFLLSVLFSVVGALLSISAPVPALVLLPFSNVLCLPVAVVVVSSVPTFHILRSCRLYPSRPHDKSTTKVANERR